MQSDVSFRPRRAFTLLVGQALVLAVALILVLGSLAVSRIAG